MIDHPRDTAGLVGVQLAQHLGSDGGERRHSGGGGYFLGVLRASLRDRIEHRRDAERVGVGRPVTTHPVGVGVGVASASTATSVAAASSVASTTASANAAALARRAAIAIERRHARLAAKPAANPIDPILRLGLGLRLGLRHASDESEKLAPTAARARRPLARHGELEGLHRLFGREVRTGRPRLEPCIQVERCRLEIDRDGGCIASARDGSTGGSTALGMSSGSQTSGCQVHFARGQAQGLTRGAAAARVHRVRVLESAEGQALARLAAGQVALARGAVAVAWRELGLDASHAAPPPVRGPGFQMLSMVDHCGEPQQVLLGQGVFVRASDLRGGERPRADLHRGICLGAEAQDAETGHLGRPLRIRVFAEELGDQALSIGCGCGCLLGVHCA